VEFGDGFKIPESIGKICSTTSENQLKHFYSEVHTHLTEEFAKHDNLLSELGEFKLKNKDGPIGNDQPSIKFSPSEGNRNTLDLFFDTITFCALLD